MSVQIIDNFILKDNSPIDIRLVVGNGFYYNTKEEIEYKYPGLRVWDSNSKKTYKYDGSNWIEENSDNIVGLGTTNNITLFSNNSIIDSIVVENSGNIGIGKTPNHKLDIDGNIKATTFIGNGSQIEDIDASNISSGLLDIGLIEQGNNGYILKTNSGNIEWVDSSSLNTTSGETNKIKISLDDSTTTYRNLLLIKEDTNSGTTEIVTDNALEFNPDKGDLKVTGKMGIENFNIENGYSINVENILSKNNIITGPNLIDNINGTLLLFREGSRYFIDGYLDSDYIQNNNFIVTFSNYHPVFDGYIPFILGATVYDNNSSKCATAKVEIVSSFTTTSIYINGLLRNTIGPSFDLNTGDYKLYINFSIIYDKYKFELVDEKTLTSPEFAVLVNY
jgi:hypothetical protein